MTWGYELLLYVGLSKILTCKPAMNSYSIECISPQPHAKCIFMCQYCLNLLTGSNKCLLHYILLKCSSFFYQKSLLNILLKCSSFFYQKPAMLLFHWLLTLESIKINYQPTAFRNWKWPPSLAWTTYIRHQTQYLGYTTSKFREGRENWAVSCHSGPWKARWPHMHLFSLFNLKSASKSQFNNGMWRKKWIINRTANIEKE